MTKVSLVLPFVLNSLADAAFEQPWHLVITIGTIYPISCLYYLPAATLLFEWFQVRRGFASGVLFAGTGAGGTVFPFIMQGLIRRFGYRAAMVSLVRPPLSSPLASLLTKRTHRESATASSVSLRWRLSSLAFRDRKSVV